MCNVAEKNAQVIQWALSYFDGPEYHLNAEGDVVSPDDVAALPPKTYPKQLHPVAILEPSGGFSLRLLPWGIPREIKGATKPLTKFVTNARDDKLSSWSWRYCVKERRCLVPASAYYEPDGPVGAKWWVRFNLRDRPAFWLAGLWEADATGNRTFTVVTTSPNELAAKIQDRMPLVLDESGAREWFGHTPLAPERLAALCQPYPASAMQSAALPPPTKPVKASDLATGSGELKLE